MAATMGADGLPAVHAKAFPRCMHMQLQHALHKKARVFPHAQEERKAEKPIQNCHLS